MTQEVIATIQKQFSVEDISLLHNTHSNASLMKNLTQVRILLEKSHVIESFQKRVLRELNWEPQEFFFDCVRLRMITPQMHSIEKAEAAFYAHRDTWYSNPQEQINIWIPLFSYKETETFLFFPDYFTKAVENDSHLFDYDWWKKHIGFQKLNPTKAIYPKSLITLQNGLRFSCTPSQRLIFSAQHIHQTLPNKTQKIRWSIDFRVVHQAEHTISGPINVDSKSIGQTILDYRKEQPTKK